MLFLKNFSHGMQRNWNAYKSFCLYEIISKFQQYIFYMSYYLNMRKKNS